MKQMIDRNRFINWAVIENPVPVPLIILLIKIIDKITPKRGKTDINETAGPRSTICPLIAFWKRVSDNPYSIQAVIDHSGLSINFTFSLSSQKTPRTIKGRIEKNNSIIICINECFVDVRFA